MRRERIFRDAGWLAALCVALLAGCTSYVTTQVTAFSDWSGSDATRTYAFTRSDAQKNSIEQSTYEPIVAGELSSYAFRQVPQASARYLVGLSYGVGSDLVAVPTPVYYDPWFPGPYWRRGPWGPWGPWGPFPAGYVNQTYQVFDYTLGIRITERATGKEVYNVTARTTGDNGVLLYAMPFLARSALADFPLGNGAVRTVRLPVDKKGGPAAPAANERAVSAAPASGAAAVK
ncbi:DUF4136 domain-containing protein [Burkholderia ubonensis]|uniref:DUF4136 domain-containing protein n=1 Tax=Burkholderia ubonensis TaxID=101571 RepID=UPI00075DE30A|nr:DUF4136 domain-containing protein [Burkholderia ubonensis]KVU65663.1 hypothetical protein WK71_20145 [Burkholderia ubonensis]